MRHNLPDRSPTERFISQLLEDGVRPSQIPLGDLVDAIASVGSDAYVTVKIPSHSECMIPIAVARELVAREVKQRAGGLYPLSGSRRYDPESRMPSGPPAG